MVVLIVLLDCDSDWEIDASPAVIDFRKWNVFDCQPPYTILDSGPTSAFAVSFVYTLAMLVSSF
jgi:hypothetical protein